jgi:hypothetical protein
MVCLRPRRITETKRSEPRLAIIKPGRFTRSFCGSLTRANLALHHRWFGRGVGLVAEALVRSAFKVVAGNYQQSVSLANFYLQRRLPEVVGSLERLATPFLAHLPCG